MAEGQIEPWIKKQTGVQVEAIRLNEDNAEMAAAWCRGDLVEEIDPEHPDEMQPGVNVPTPQGSKRASLHMYIVKYGSHFFVVHTRVFEDGYMPMNRANPAPESIGDTRRRLGFADPFEGRHSI
jgi:hypothetical protein